MSTLLTRTRSHHRSDQGPWQAAVAAVVAVAAAVVATKMQKMAAAMVQTLLLVVDVDVGDDYVAVEDELDLWGDPPCSICTDDTLS